MAFDLGFAGNEHLQPQLYVHFIASKHIALQMRMIPLLVPAYSMHQMLERTLLMHALGIFDGALVHVVHT